jgi:hypothetical protein
MSADRTLPQSPEELDRARERSVQESGEGPRHPPTQVPGYQVERFLGAGAYGEVWVATDGNTGRRVAVKFYNHRGGVDWSLLSREVEKLAFLFADRYVVQLIDVAWDAEPPYYIMEFLEQGSLEERMEHGPVPVAEAVKLFREVAVVLSHSHGKGVLHCDLKPANVLLDQDFRPRLADFGQSRLSHEQKPALGTLFYMAPEQADLAAVPDVRWDVYALGALFYAMLTGQPPCRDQTAVTEIDGADALEERLARYRKVIETAPRPSLHRKVPGVDRELADVIDRCLESRPERRYANVQAVLNALDARTLRQARRPLLVMGALGPALLLLVMSVFALRGYHSAVSDMENAVGNWAIESNLLAAQFAAGMASQEIEGYFRAVEKDVGQDARFQELVAAVVADEELTDLARRIDELERSFVDAELHLAHEDSDGTVQQFLVGQPAGAEGLRAEQIEEVRQLRAQYKAHPAQQALQQWFQRCQDEVNNYELDRKRWKVASAFVIDPQGTSLARAPAANTVGSNFAFRTYFNGEATDRPRDWRPGPDDHVERTHLSAVFRSQATGKWIIAVSAPVWQGGPGGTFLGVAVFTVEVPNFLKFQGRSDQFAVLVDGRDGPNRGLILQHPLIETLEKLPEHFAEYKVPPDMLPAADHPGDLPSDDGPRRYRDPLGGDPDGERYNRDWLASLRPVSIERVQREGEVHSGIAATSAREPTGLWVVVQQDYEAVFAPGQTLGHKLVRNGLMGLAVVVFVVTLLWGVVIVVFNESGRSRLVATLRRRAGLKTPTYSSARASTSSPRGRSGAA